jgi:hypothetical protein
MFEEVSGLPDQVALEEAMLRFWEEHGIFEKLRARNRGGARFSFLDGPITANNPMGVHHAWGRTLKDAYQRYWAMRGRDQRYQNGFDCQGLWIEVETGAAPSPQARQQAWRRRVRAALPGAPSRHHHRRVIPRRWIRTSYTDSERTTPSGRSSSAPQRGLVAGTDVMPWCHAVLASQQGWGLSGGDASGRRTRRRCWIATAVRLVGRPLMDAAEGVMWFIPRCAYAGRRVYAARHWRVMRSGEGVAREGCWGGAGDTRYQGQSATCQKRLRWRICVLRGSLSEGTHRLRPAAAGGRPGSEYRLPAVANR